MKRTALKLLAATFLLLALTLTAHVTGQQKSEPWKELPERQKTRPWIEWSKNEAEKLLSESPWTRTQVDTDLSEMFYKPTANSAIFRNAPNSSARLEEGATNQEVKTRYHIRFFSARPVRQALARLFELRQKLDERVILNLRTFAEIESTNFIILTVTFESSDQRAAAKVMQTFNSAVTGTLRNGTYLERADGKRLFLAEYEPPGKDGFGARFIFSKTEGGLPFISNDSGEVRFHSEFGAGTKLKLDTSFKLADMMYRGRLEY